VPLGGAGPCLKEINAPGDLRKRTFLIGESRSMACESLTDASETGTTSRKGETSDATGTAESPTCGQRLHGTQS